MIISMDRLNRLFLVRHGQVVGHDGFSANGHTDVDITDVGRGQMEYLAERLRLSDIGIIHSSDLRRSMIGARIIARHHEATYNISPEFRELYFGDWEGLPLTEIRQDYPGELEKRRADIVHYRPPGKGESMNDLSERVLPHLRKILDEEKGRDVLIVAHGGVNRVILCEALGLDLVNVFNIQQDYGCLNIIDYYPDSTLVRLING
jgi:alpha-ribazole phosphatase